MPTPFPGRGSGCASPAGCATASCCERLCRAATTTAPDPAAQGRLGRAGADSGGRGPDPRSRRPLRRHASPTCCGWRCRPGHAATEEAAPRPRAAVAGRSTCRDRWSTTRPAQAFSRRCRSGGQPRALWQVTPSASPSGDWAVGLASAARACAESGRGAVLVVPDQRDLAAAAGGLRRGARAGRLRRAGRRGRAGGPLPGVPGRSARRRPGGDRQPRGRVRAGPRSRPGRAVGRRRRPAGRAARALSAHPDGAGPARQPSRAARCCSPATPGLPRLQAWLRAGLVAAAGRGPARRSGTPRPG